ncbi:MAG: hypothetical protein K0S21_3663, partial [Rhizobiaceae bacterium]|nr:hypothetical protein [Rhizobiaceae bacterium]
MCRMLILWADRSAAGLPGKIHKHLPQILCVGERCREKNP